MANEAKVPQSRVNINYNIEVKGQKKRKELCFKQLLIGDFSFSNSYEEKYSLGERQIYDIPNSNLSNVMKDMGVKFKAEVEDKTGDGSTINVEIPIESIKSFNPNSIINCVPQLQTLLEIKRLLKEYEISLDNNRKLRNFIKNEVSTTDGIAELRGSLGMDEIKSFKLGGEDE